MRGSTRFISNIEHDISRVNAARNESGISKQPCIFLFVIYKLQSFLAI